MVRPGRRGTSGAVTEAQSFDHHTRQLPGRLGHPSLPRGRQVHPAYDRMHAGIAGRRANVLQCVHDIGMRAGRQQRNDTTTHLSCVALQGPIPGRVASVQPRWLRRKTAFRPNGSAGPPASGIEHRPLLPRLTGGLENEGEPVRVQSGILS